MLSPESRAHQVAELLTAATGTEARIAETPDAVRVEVDVPEEITMELLTALITALTTADRYGHDHTRAVAVAWAEFLRQPWPPASPPAPTEC